MKPETLKGHLDALILSVVETAPLHGYAIISELRQRSGGTLALPEGTVYPALHRLEEEGALRSRWATVGGRRRRVYALTRSGRASLNREARGWRTFAAGVRGVLEGLG